MYDQESAEEGHTCPCQRQLDRGFRMVEILKQDQYQPMDVADQVVAIWAGVNGYADKVPVEQVREFERQLLEYIRSTHAEIPEAIDRDKDITEETEKLLRSTVGDFSEGFLTGRTADPRAAAGAAAGE